MSNRLHIRGEYIANRKELHNRVRAEAPRSRNSFMASRTSSRGPATDRGTNRRNPMDLRYGNGKTKYGPGVSIDLTGEEAARAIFAWVVGQGVHIDGPRTLTVNGELIEHAKIYVDPSGFVITSDGKKMPGGPASAGPNRCELCDPSFSCWATGIHCRKDG